MNARDAAIFLAALVAVALFTHGYASDGGSESSRFALVESLVERGTFAIDDSTFADTVDRARIGNHWYSDKPPLLSVVSAPVYALLHACGLSFRETPRTTIYLMSLLVSGASLAFLALLFFRALPNLGVDGADRWLQTAGAAFGTLAFAFATTFSNHAVSALALFAGAVSFLDRAAFRAGLFLGAAAAIEIPVGGLFLAVLGIVLVVESAHERRWQRLATFVIGGAIPIAATAALGLLAYGDPRPAYLIPEAFRFEGSLHTGSGFAGISGAPARLAYAVHALVGNRGLFVHSPVVVLVVPAVVILAMRRDEPHRRDRLVLAVSAVATIVFHLLQTSDGGGWAWGFRFFTAISPLLLFVAAPFLARARAAFVALLVPSVLLALLGATDPWPVVDEGQGVKTFVPYPRCPIAANLATAAQEWLPAGGTRDAAVRALLGDDEAASYGYLGRAFANRREFSKALGCFRRAARAAPDDPAIGKFVEQLEASPR
ncbi:MAG: hypothetical protein HY292_17475 [Planctomycetes bacterium]|nr:hypothetical protein [Planctomycetota bacterium]